MEEKLKSFPENLAPDQRRLISDYALVLDMTEKIATSRNESDVIDKIMEVFLVLCAPGQISYLPFSKGAPGNLMIFPSDSKSIEVEKKRLCAFSKPYGWNETEDGFILKINYMNELLGILSVEKIAFRAYREHYLNLALNLVKVFGLAIFNARVHQNMENLIKQRTYELHATNMKLQEEILERRKSEEALRESEKRYRMMIETANDAIFMADAATGILIDANRKAEELIGLSKNKIIGMHQSRLHPPEEAERYRNIFENHVKTGFTNEDIYVMTSTGLKIPVDIRISVTEIENRTIVLGIFRDIREQKQAERAMRTLNEFNQVLLTVTNEQELLNELCRIIVEVGGYRLTWIGYAQTDEDKKVKPVARAGHDVGYLDKIKITWADDQHGKGPTGKTIRTGRPSVIRNIPTDPEYEPWREQAAKRGYASSAAIPLIEGTRCFGALNIYNNEPDAFNEKEMDLLQKLADKLSIGIQAIRARLEKQRAEEEKLRLYTAMEQSAEAIIMTDASGIIQYVNTAFTRLTGYEKSEAVGKTPSFLKSGKHDHHYYKRMWETITSGKVWTGIFINRRKDGNLYEEEANISPIWDKTGKIAYYVAVKRDVTQEKLLHKARDYFTSVTSHELRTPITKLQLTKVLLDNLKPAGVEKEKLDQISAVLSESYDELNRILSATALLADLNLQQYEKHFYPVYLYLVVITCIETAKDYISKSNRMLNLIIDMESFLKDVEILGIQEMVVKAINNTISNAIKYTPDGKSIKIKGWTEESHAVIEIKDEGDGIAKEKIDMVLEPYFSLGNILQHSTGQYSYHGGGIGLGLTLTKMVMDYHEGNIDIKSEGENKGTTVTLRFPRHFPSRNSASV